MDEDQHKRDAELLHKAAELMEQGHDEAAVYLLYSIYRRQLQRDLEKTADDSKVDALILQSTATEIMEFAIRLKHPTLVDLGKTLFDIYRDEARSHYASLLGSAKTAKKVAAAKNASLHSNTIEAQKKRSAAQKMRWQKDKGTQRSDEAKEKMRIAQQARRAREKEQKGEQG